MPDKTVFWNAGPNFNRYRSQLGDVAGGENLSWGGLWQDPDWMHVEKPRPRP